MTDSLFHIVDRATAPDQPVISTGIATDTWRFALYRRAPGYVYGHLIALLSDEMEARLVCVSLNASTSFLNALFREDKINGSE